jgi:hypothetical protein
MTRRCGTVVLAALVAGCLSASAADAQERRGFAIEIEGGPVWLSRNDVRIPNETGTEFSLVDVIGSGPWGAVRFELGFDLNDRHGFRVVAAPLRIEDAGVLDTETRFAGATFAPGVATDAVYDFSSYRVTYRYRFFAGDRWQWKVGATLFVRDARIALQQPGTFAEDTDVGIVPLAHLQGLARLSDTWHLLVDFEGLGSTQGRAFDIAVKVAYRLAERWQLAFGYRTIEGGADVDDVYNFAWLHFGVASVRVAF